MQQEMFDSKLLNTLCIYAALRWLELPPDERIFDRIVQPVAASEENVNEEDIVGLFSNESKLSKRGLPRPSVEIRGI